MFAIVRNDSKTLVASSQYTGTYVPGGHHLVGSGVVMQKRGRGYGAEAQNQAVSQTRS